jgi:hypothetical protein
MTKIQLAQFRTLRAVNRLLNRSKPIWSSFTAISTQQGVLSAKLEMIEALAQEQEEDKTGIRADKSRLAEQLITGVMRIAGPLGAWALITNEERVRAQADLTPGALRRLSAERLIAEARIIHKSANQHLGHLADYAINTNVLEVLESRIAAFDDLVIAPKEGIARTTALTQLLAKEVDSAMELLRGFFDRMAYAFETDHPEFFANYQAASRVIPLPRGRRTKEELAAERAKANAANATGTAAQTNDDEAEVETEATSDEVKAVLAESDLGTRVQAGHGAELAS